MSGSPLFHQLRFRGVLSNFPSLCPEKKIGTAFYKMIKTDTSSSMTKFLKSTRMKITQTLPFYTLLYPHFYYFSYQELWKSLRCVVSMIQQDWVPFQRAQAGYKCYLLGEKRSVWSGEVMKKVKTGLFYSNSSKTFMKNDITLNLTCHKALAGWHRQEDSL